MLEDINKDFYEFENCHWRNSMLGYGYIDVTIYIVQNSAQ